MARTCFVTGAHGLAGTWLVRALLARGDAVVVLRRDRPPVSSLTLLGLDQHVTTVDGDVRDGDVVERALAEHAVDTVFHLAAQTIVGVAHRSPASTFDTNVRGTWTVLEAVRRLEVPRTVVASSDKAYGPSTDLPYREDHPLRPTFPYDVSKAAADLVASSYHHAYGVRVAVTRFANLYGGGDLHLSRLVPEAAIAALSGRRPVLRSDGSPQRDFLHAADAATAYLAVADAIDAGVGAGEAFNAGSGEPRRVGDVAALVCELAGTGVTPDVQGAGVPSGEIDRQWVDATKLRERTGWAPRYDLREGLDEAVGWYRTHLDRLTAMPA